MKTNWRGRRVTVMGLGLFTGGVATVKYFAERGAKVLVTDKRSREQLAESVAAVEGPNVSFRLGTHDVGDFTGADLVVSNPAVPPDNEFLAAARVAGVPVEAEMNIVFKRCRAPIVGVTGSNGKSTTAALIAHILKTAGAKVRLGGNIGRSLLGDAEKISPREIVVLEISSFQLEYLHLDKLSPHVAVVMNVQPNHLDRHKTMKAYAEAKRHLVEHQTGRDFAVLNADDARVRAMAKATDAKTVFFSVEKRLRQGVWLDGDSIRCVRGAKEAVIGGLERMKLIGIHNRQNACAAIGAVLVFGVEQRAIERALRTFKPLPHRLETICVRRGVRYVNDSIGTNPHSVAAALACFDGDVILVAGGAPKDIPYDVMLPGIVEKVKLLLLIGRAAHEIESAVRKVSRRKPDIVQAGTLEKAMAIVRRRAQKGDTVLLSPACASFDQFRNFEERGERFASLARKTPR